MEPIEREPSLDPPDISTVVNANCVISVLLSGGNWLSERSLDDRRASQLQPKQRETATARARVSINGAEDSYGNDEMKIEGPGLQRFCSL